MAAYKLFFKKSVEKELKAACSGDSPESTASTGSARNSWDSPRRLILSRIEALAEDLRPPGCEKLTGHERYRVRQGRYRIVYSIHDDELTVWVIKVGQRKDVYR